MTAGRGKVEVGAGNLKMSALNRTLQTLEK